MKRRGAACSLDEPEEGELAADYDVLQEICERDAFNELMGHLGPDEQCTLDLLRTGMTLREIGGMLNVSAVAVLRRRREIAGTALGLGIQPEKNSALCG
jgi:hypothetical protein